VGKKGIWVIAIAAAFIAGTITTGTVAYAASGGQGDSLIVIAINDLTAAVLGIEPTVNVNSEVTKNVVVVVTPANSVLVCGDGSSIPFVTALTFTMSDFADLPVKLVLGGGGSTLFNLFFYNVDIDDDSFEITGTGNRIGGPAVCGLTGVTFTFSISGECAQNTQVDFTTEVGMSITTASSSVSCLVVTDPGVGIIAPG